MHPTPSLRLPAAGRAPLGRRWTPAGPLARCTPPPAAWGGAPLQRAAARARCARLGLGHRPAPLAAGGGGDAPPTAPTILTEAELDAAAADRGVSLGISTLGPFWRVTCRADEETIVGVAEGFCALGVLHIDTMRIYNSRLKSGQKGVWGLTILVGVAAGLHGLGRGCNKAEILAINDDDEQHQRLVRFYRRIGWEPVREVEGGRLQDIPDMLVWGGRGTRMDGDVAGLVAKWSGSLRAKPQGGSQ